MRKVVIIVLFVAILGAIGAAGFMYYQERITDNNWQQVHLAEAMLKKDDYQTAVNYLMPVVEYGKQFEGSEKALFLLAKTYEAMEAPQQTELWRRFIERYPESDKLAKAKLHLAEALTQQDSEQARSMYQELTESGIPAVRDQARLGLAKSFENEGQQQEARELYYQILEDGVEDEVITYAKNRLTEMNSATLWSPALDEFSQLYTVKRGDSPIEIAGQHKTTAWFVKEANNISNAIHPGKRLKVPKEPLYVVVNKQQCRLNLYTESGKFVKWFPVGIGTEDWRTPAGEYEIVNKEIDPVWYKPGGGIVPPDDPDNALGSRWMGIGNSLGIHGTNAPDTIGKRSSAGCIRMYNEDAEELYKLITYGTKVIIKEGSPNEES